MMPNAARVLVASNRGPVAFARDADGAVVARRGGGGLVTALTSAMSGTHGMWIAAAMSAEDRRQAAAGRIDVAVEGADYRLRYLHFSPAVYDRAYNDISNRVLWFVHHNLWDVPRVPNFDDRFRRSWDSYRQVNEAFAAALDEEAGPSSAGPIFLVQDYHLCLVPAMLRARRPDARIDHFMHIPFAGRSYLRILPHDVREEMLAGLLGADIVGFHHRAWADNFLACCELLRDAQVDLRRREVRWRGRTVRVGVYPISIDPAALRAQAADPAVRRARRRVERWRDGRAMIVRVDRADLSKNILRGFQAYESFLRHAPRWRDRIFFLALIQSSRGEIAEYRQYLRECLRAAGRVNASFGTPGWQPVRVVVGDHFPLVLAAYEMYDVLMVNPVFDGMNLVAKEGPLLNELDGVLILSENAGASAELGANALVINPFDVAQTEAAIRRGLTMPPEERAANARGLRLAVESNTVLEWVTRQIEDLGPVVKNGPPASRGSAKHGGSR
jgi:trehalose 6-phosphate synthase